MKMKRFYYSPRKQLGFLQICASEARYLSDNDKCSRPWVCLLDHCINNEYVTRLDMLDDIILINSINLVPI